METNVGVLSRDGYPSESVSSRDGLLWESLTHLQLNIAQTAALCGISVRQLGYWTKQGYVGAEGLGERRFYGLDSLRRILAIRCLMAEGSSLRQALKSLPASGATLPAPFFPAFAENSSEPAPNLMLPEDADALATAMVRLFDLNRHVRENADGLAVKLGRASVPVRYIAEALCARGVLSKTLVQDDAVYQRLEGTAQ